MKLDEFCYDVLGIGCVAVDDLIYVDSYPQPDAKVPVRRRERHGGGLTATALVAASRLGSRCAYAGVLGDDDLSLFSIERLTQEGIDLTYLLREPGAQPIYALIVVDQTNQTRTIFFDRTSVVGAGSAWPEAEVIRSARVLLVDHIGIEGMLRAARIAREARIPIVGDFERDESKHFSELIDMVDHLILSRNFASRLTGIDDPAGAALALWTSGRRMVAVTLGAEGCWYLTDAQPATPQYQPAYDVDVVDTTGCGDVFHGAYASALSRDLAIPDCIRFAAATAALKATQTGGQQGIPTREEVEAFLEMNE